MIGYWIADEARQFGLLPFHILGGICLTSYHVRRMSVHPVVQIGFGSDSAKYDSARPDDQPAAVSKLLEELAIPPGGRIVEIGS